MRRYLPGLLLVSPALAIIVFLFLVPLTGAVTGAFQDPDGGFSFGNFFKTYQLYSTDILFTIVIVALSALLTAAFSVAIAGYLTLGTSPVAVAILRWLYRWPLFIPFIVVGQILRTFLAKNGLMNNIFVASGLITPLHTIGFLDWRGIVIAFVWKQTPFVTLLLAGAMASIDRGTIEAARNLGASRLRILLEIVLPQATVLVGSYGLLWRWLLPDRDSAHPPTPRDIARAAAEKDVPFVLVTGIPSHPQHVENALVSADAIYGNGEFELFETEFLGAGDTLSAALAALLAAETSLSDATAEALAYLDKCLEGGIRPGMGKTIPDRLFWAHEDEGDEAPEGAAGETPSPDSQLDADDFPLDTTKH